MILRESDDSTQSEDSIPQSDDSTTQSGDYISESDACRHVMTEVNE
jgi:hypothetical protein